MLRKLLLAAAAVAMPIGVVAATAGPASAAKVIDNTGPAHASCTSSGGSITFKVPIGIVTSGGYQAPTKNKGQQIKVAGVVFTCTSSAVTGTFTGTLSGKIKTTNPTDTPAQEYSCTGLVGVSPVPPGTLAGTLKVKWAAPVGQKFGGGSKTAITVTSISGGVDGGGHGTFTIPGHPGTGSLSGSFAGTDGGASSTSTNATADTEASLAGLCSSAAGLSSINLGSGTVSLS